MEITRLCRYPVKGLSVEDLQEIHLNPDEPVPGDRRFALSMAGMDNSQTAWKSKASFLTLVCHEKLAALETQFNEETNTLSILRMGKEVSSGCLGDPSGRATVEDFLFTYLARSVPAKPHIVAADEGIALTDTQTPFISIVNLASVRDLERVVGAEINPLRFRANVYFDCGQPWCELDWIGHDIAIGIARLNIAERTGRCAATGVDPESGIRDHNIVAILQSEFDHTDMGVYATVMNSSNIAIGDSVIS